MSRFFLKGPGSLTMVLLVLLLTVALQASISYTLTFGRLDSLVAAGTADSTLAAVWLGARVALLVVAAVLWALRRNRALFRMIIVVNAVLTFGLVMNMSALSDTLFHFSGQAGASLIADVAFMAATNILIFSIWYWLIDPPGVEDEQRDDAWDFLFPQRASVLEHYESWQPRYSDYLYLAFTTSLAFSPADTLPLTRRAKMLMALQALVSAITLTVIVGSTINVLASAS